MFIPGETIIHQFNLPFTSQNIQNIYVTYKQQNRKILTKIVYNGDIKPFENAEGESTSGKPVSYFTVRLSQEESLLFKDDTDYTAQLNVLFMDGTRCTSTEISGLNGIQHIRKVVSINGQ